MASARADGASRDPLRGVLASLSRGRAGKLRNSPLPGTRRFQHSLVSPVGRLGGILEAVPRFPIGDPQLRSRSWRLRKAPKAPWRRHSRAILARARHQHSTVTTNGRPRGPCLRMAAKRAPCAFTETAVKRAIRAVRAAGETPGRMVVTKDGFAIEFAAPPRATIGDPNIRPSTTTAVVNTWDDLS
jgi:hypothetical protein